MRHITLEFCGAAGPRALTLMVSESAPERMRGLLGRPMLGPAQGMLLDSCRLIHTFGMRYRLDLVYLNRQGLVLKVTEALAARRIDGHWRAHSVLEMAGGEARRCGIAAGVQLPLAAIARAAQVAA